MTSADPLEWTRARTPILQSLQRDHADPKPFDGLRVAVASHLEYKTGVFIETVRAAGATILVTGSEPFSTVDSVAKWLDRDPDIHLFVEADMDEEAWVAGQHKLLEAEPDIILDDGCELIAKVHASHPEIARDVIGGGEQTTAGVTRLEAMADAGVLEFPVYAVNNTPMKRNFDNVHGTGESTLSNIQITTNTILSGSNVVVAGYGYCGRGIARKARGMGAKTTVTEVDPRRALEAHMDGHHVRPMAAAAPEADYVITATGSRDIVRREHIERLPDGAILANAGHFDVEIVVGDLASMAERTSSPRPGITRYHLPDGRRISLLAAGRLVNLTGPYSSGHPAAVMDTTFAMMFVAAHEFATDDPSIGPGVHRLPDRLDRQVARRKLDATGIEIDVPTDSQKAYAEDWELDGDPF